MLTSFFGKSKPVNFIIASIYIILGWFYWFLLVNEQVTAVSFFKTQTVFLFIIVFSVFLLNFIIKKNKLTETNTYSILFFGCFVLLFPEVFFHSNVIIPNLLLLFAYRRIMSLNSGLNLEKKILDASIWITIASLFYFWCILFFIVLFVAVFQIGSKNYKLTLIPFVGFLAVIIILTAIKVLLTNSFLWFLEVDTSLSLDFQSYDSLALIIPISFLILILIWTLIQKLINFSEIRLLDKSNSFLLILILLICVIIILFIPNKNGAEFLYIMAPLAIFTTNFIEKTTQYWVKELFLWVLVALPILVVFL